MMNEQDKQLKELTRNMVQNVAGMPFFEQVIEELGYTQSKDKGVVWGFEMATIVANYDTCMNMKECASFLGYKDTKAISRQIKNGTIKTLFGKNNQIPKIQFLMPLLQSKDREHLKTIPRFKKLFTYETND